MSLSGNGSNLSDVAHLGSRPKTMIDTAIAFLVMTWTAVLLRVYVRAWMIRSFGWDDALMVLTLVMPT